MNFFDDDFVKCFPLLSDLQRTKLNELKINGFPVDKCGLDTCKHQQVVELGLNMPDACLMRKELDIKQMT